MDEYNLVVENDGEDTWGFNIQFDRPYDIRTENLPISSDLATLIIEDAYTHGYAPEDFGQAKGDKTVVGTITVTEDENDFNIDWDEELVEEIY